MDADKHYNSFQFYIIEAVKIKSELLKHETEYFPEKVRELINSYKYTIKKVIEHGRLYLKANTNDEEKTIKIQSAITAYEQLLDSLN